MEVSVTERELVVDLIGSPGTVTQYIPSMPEVPLVPDPDVPDEPLDPLAPEVPLVPDPDVPDEPLDPFAPEVPLDPFNLNSCVHWFNEYVKLVIGIIGALQGSNLIGYRKLISATQPLQLSFENSYRGVKLTESMTLIPNSRIYGD